VEPLYFEKRASPNNNNNHALGKENYSIGHFVSICLMLINLSHGSFFHEIFNYWFPSKELIPSQHNNTMMAYKPRILIDQNRKILLFLIHSRKSVTRFHVESWQALFWYRRTIWPNLYGIFIAVIKFLITNIAWYLPD
jgi:hypothetical protein